MTGYAVKGTGSHLQERIEAEANQIHPARKNDIKKKLHGPTTNYRNNFIPSTQALVSVLHELGGFPWRAKMG